MQAGAEALRRRDPGAARQFFEQVVSARPGDVWGPGTPWRSPARGLGDAKGLMDALDRVLTANPGHLPALLMKGDHFSEVGDGRSADAPSIAPLSPARRRSIP